MQVFLLHGVSSIVGQVTTVAGFTLQAGGSSSWSQYRTPLQRLPSSWLSQSELLAQVQVLMPPGWHLPATQPSPTVHLLPSSQALSSATDVGWHLPVFSSHRFFVQSVSLAWLHWTTVDGLMPQVHGKTALLQ